MFPSYLFIDKVKNQKLTNNFSEEKVHALSIYMYFVVFILGKLTSFIMHMT